MFVQFYGKQAKWNIIIKLAGILLLSAIVFIAVAIQ